MARRPRFNLRLQSLVLLVLVPGLLLSTALFGWGIYQRVYDIIMTGFDQKLKAVSTVTGAFIRAEDHEELFRIRDVRSLTAAPDSSMFGVDYAAGTLVHIDLEQGGALEVTELPVGVRDIAIDPETGRLWAATTEPATLQRIDPATGAAEEIAPLARTPDGLAYDANTRTLYAGGDLLEAIDPATGVSRPVSAEGLTGPVRSPAFDAASNTLFVLQGDDEELVAIDLATNRARSVGPLHDPEPIPEEERLFQRGALPRMLDLAVATDGELLGAADRLVRIDPATAAVDSAGLAVGFRSEKHPLYARYAEPMQRIMAKKDITYLYTETVGVGGVLTYGIDGTVGEDHSLIGTSEAIADDEIPAMERAMYEGQVRLSDLEDWGSWGLLKTADAPIYRDDGTVGALAAADVDISVILEKTRLALVQVGLVATLTLVLGAIVSWFISRRLVAPLTEVKEGALQLAAGQYGHRIANQDLLELRDLSESFNSMSEALGTTIDELTRTNRALESVRRRRALEVALADPGYNADPGLPFLVERPDSQEGAAHDPSGYVHVGGRTGDWILMWIADPISDSPLENLRLRREIAALARPVLAQHRQSWDTAANFFADLFPRIRSLVLLDGTTRTIQAHTRSTMPLAVVEESGKIRKIDLARAPSFALGPKEWAVVAAIDPVAAAEAIRQERLEGGHGSDGKRLHRARRNDGSYRLSQMSVALFGSAMMPEFQAEEGVREMVAPSLEVLSR